MLVEPVGVQAAVGQHRGRLQADRLRRLLGVPHRRRVSVRGAIPLAWSLDHVGPMCWTSEDCALMMQVLAAHDPLDAGSAKVVAEAGGKDPAMLDTLAAAYAEAGRFTDAVRTAQAALELARGAGKAEQAQAD